MERERNTSRKGAPYLYSTKNLKGGEERRKNGAKGGGDTREDRLLGGQKTKNTKKILLVGNVTKKVQNVTNKDKNVKTVRNNRETDVVPPLPYYGIEWEGERRGGDNPVGKANVGT